MIVENTGHLTSQEYNRRVCPGRGTKCLKYGTSRIYGKDATLTYTLLSRTHSHENPTHIRSPADHSIIRRTLRKLTTSIFMHVHDPMHSSLA